jgi:hypothetical protein
MLNRLDRVRWTFALVWPCWNERKHFVTEDSQLSQIEDWQSSWLAIPLTVFKPWIGSWITITISLIYLLFDVRVMLRVYFYSLKKQLLDLTNLFRSIDNSKRTFFVCFDSCSINSWHGSVCQTVTFVLWISVPLNYIDSLFMISSYDYGEETVDAASK